MRNIRLLVCDLDNTLYDWVSYFVPSFYAMVDSVVQITGCDREKLLDEFRHVHQRQGDSEQPFALLETQTVKEKYRGRAVASVVETLDPAFHAFNSARKRNLHLHPSVKETLEILSSSDVRLIAHTESKLYGVVDRLRRLGLVEYFSRIYCRERSSLPHPLPERGADWLVGFPMERVIELSHHQSKPNPSILLEICSAEGIAAAETAYVGDSMARDMLMAKNAGVFAIWAAYGSRHDSALYDSLVRISHWTGGEVAREKKLSEQAKTISPDFIADKSFAQVLDAIGLSTSNRAHRNRLEAL